MLYLWNARLETGIPKIDEQHKELFRQVGNLLDQTKAKADRIPETLDFLGDYVIKHFTDEQGMQAAVRYPKAAAHKKMHTAFTSELKNLKKKFETAGDSLKFEVVTEINHTAINWLKDHIMVNDQEFAAYYRRHNEAGRDRAAAFGAQAQARPGLWRAEYETGLPKLDAQHQELVRRIETLISQAKTGQVTEALNSLGEGAARHFKSEERVQAAIGYPAAGEHKKCHDAFARKYPAFKNKYETACSGDRPEVVRKLNQALVGWVKDHIMTWDQDFASYYQKRRRTGVSGRAGRGFLYRLFHPWSKD